MTVDEMLSKMSSIELAEWKAHFILTNEEQQKRDMIASAESGAERRRWNR